jgi:hypothetical protein
VDYAGGIRAGSLWQKYGNLQRLSASFIFQVTVVSVRYGTGSGSDLVLPDLSLQEAPGLLLRRLPFSLLSGSLSFHQEVNSVPRA